MWFKNLLSYQLDTAFTLTLKTLNDALQQHRYTPCRSSDQHSMGWLHPLNKLNHEQDQADELAIEINNQLLLALMVERKVIPNSHVKQEFHKRVMKHEAALGQSLSRSEKKRLLDDIMHELLPRAFSNFKTIYVWIDLNNYQIFVNTTSADKAELALGLIRKCLGSLPVKPLTSNSGDLAPLFTQWLVDGNIPGNFDFGQEAQLTSTINEKTTISCKNQHLLCLEINTHISAGKRVTKVALTWHERVKFLLHSDFVITKILYDSSLRTQGQEAKAEERTTQFLTDFAISSGELSHMFRELLTITKQPITHSSP